MPAGARAGIVGLKIQSNRSQHKNRGKSDDYDGFSSSKNNRTLPKSITPQDENYRHSNKFGSKIQDGYRNTTKASYQNRNTTIPSTIKNSSSNPNLSQNLNKQFCNHRNIDCNHDILEGRDKRDLQDRAKMLLLESLSSNQNKNGKKRSSSKKFNSLRSGRRSSSATNINLLEADQMALKKVIQEFKSSTAIDDKIIENVTKIKSHGCPPGPSGIFRTQSQKRHQKEKQHHSPTSENKNEESPIFTSTYSNLPRPNLNDKILETMEINKKKREALENEKLVSKNSKNRKMKRKHSIAAGIGKQIPMPCCQIL